MHFLEMLYMWRPQGRLHPMQQEFLLLGLPHHLCTARKAAHADEEHPGIGACHSGLLLREASSGVPIPFSLPNYEPSSLFQPEQLEIHEAAIAELEESSRTGSHAQSSKKARAYAKSYQLGPPLVPAIIVNRINDYTNRIKITKRENFLYLMCRYWSLKREARRGAPLLKRLHLEPWSTNTEGDQNPKEMLQKLKV